MNKRLLRVKSRSDGVRNVKKKKSDESLKSGVREDVFVLRNVCFRNDCVLGPGDLGVVRETANLLICFFSLVS